MTLWEYRIVQTSLGITIEQEILQDSGKAGWELVSVAEGRTSANKACANLYFKRPLPPPAAECQHAWVQVRGGKACGKCQMVLNDDGTKR